MEHITEWKRIDRILHKDFPLSQPKQEQLEKFTKELLVYRPVQYVLGEAWFAGMKFYVNEKVLIPRPETEEMVEWIVESAKWKIENEKFIFVHVPDNDQQSTTNDSFSLQSSAFSIIDIGTGSGCIPIALKKKLPKADVTAIDVCSEALNIAVENAVSNETEIDFKLLDFLDRNKWNELGQFDIIVSNPPYVKRSEAAVMRKVVLDYEPGLALFVPDDDALIFYKQIADFALTHLKPGGMVFMEINESLGNETVALLTEKGFTNVELKKDMQGKDRIVKARLRPVLN